MKKLILASASPRRRELLRAVGFPFEVQVSKADESLPEKLDCAQTVALLSERKAGEVAGRFPEAWVLGADTVVECDGAILGKPRDKADAERMLRLLSGRVHSVYTGVCILSPMGKRVEAERTLVEFYPLSEEEISAYIRTGEPMDKAGAYGIQGRGGMLVRRIEGDYFNVVGLPVARVGRMLRALDFFE